jgi:hypothetical protein
VTGALYVPASLMAGALWAFAPSFAFALAALLSLAAIVSFGALRPAAQDTAPRASVTSTSR